MTEARTVRPEHALGERHLEVSGRAPHILGGVEVLHKVVDHQGVLGEKLKMLEFVGALEQPQLDLLRVSLVGQARARTDNCNLYDNSR